VSKKAEDIYDAINKSLQLVPMKILGILYSDNLYHTKEVVNSVVALFKDPGIRCVHSVLCYMEQDNTDKIVRKWIAEPHKTTCFQKG
jgi:hypothetical protein